MNLELIDKIIAHIGPDNFDMGNWGVDPVIAHAYDVWEPPCGTTCCIAGWADLLTVRPSFWHGRIVKWFNGDSPEIRAIRKLGLPSAQTRHGKFVPLFFEDDWPESYRPSDQLVGWQEARRLLTDLTKLKVVLTKEDEEFMFDETFAWWAQFSHSRVADGHPKYRGRNRRTVTA